ncbi:MAG: nucleotidyltransferase family protein [Phycisphaerales bacterium]|nr:nucleotidyltransferase family protein [Phycisphaerales bacterium]
MATINDITARLRAAMPGLRRDFGVRSLAVFGSAARGDSTPGSDVDILVQFEPDAPVTLFTLADLHDRLRDALGREVDVVEDHPRLRPAFRRGIEEDLVRVA